jgi:hypothetical protein
MQVQISSEWIELLIGVIGLFFLVGLLVGGIVIILDLLKWILLWATEAKDLEELRTRFDRWVGTIRERQIASGVPPTRRGAFKLLGWRTWKLAVHPIRYWRGEFLFPPKKDVPANGR